MSAIRIRDITVAYPGVVACDHISLDVHRGEIHGLVGDNGAGKSTIVRVLAGLIHPQEGTIEVDGQLVRLASPRDARRHKIGVVHQALPFIPSLTVVENLMLHDDRASTSLHSSKWKALRHELAGELSPRQRQLIYIEHLVAAQAEILILDEPTAQLSPQESDELFVELNELARGGRSVLIVSHRLSEMMRHCHRFTVLRKGEVAANVVGSETNLDQLIQLMHGVETMERKRIGDPYDDTAPPVLSCEGLATRATGLSAPALRELSFDIRKGQITGFAGQPGSGIETLVRILSGQPVAHQSGRLVVNSQNGGLLHAGVVPADRMGQGIVAGLSLGQNLALRRRELLSFAKRSDYAEFTSLKIQEFQIHPDDASFPAGQLSGGNSQKLLLARELSHAIDLLVLVNPTAGVSLHSAREIRYLLRQKAAAQGTAVVVFDDDLEELCDVADRILVFAAGTIAGELRGAAATPENIGRLWSGSPLPVPVSARSGGRT